ncbi:alpha/beta-hydrolase [Sporormia fimetaria CBS 119925]|uniref:Alpha/beta-hydrolase n=1 Tax=Sporormia fimetaria CBS 119925 TaxID=1340428 RepID=A0A6A6VAQ3_9PLEO|nr:alpha/beta-hydrolase [Sporormia fimetaria CBS 119925]
MALRHGKYLIQDRLKEKAKHHESYEQLWETKWKQPAMMSLYPFMFGTFTDFVPIISDLVSKKAGEPYDWEVYAKAHFAQAEHLTSIAAAANKNGEKAKASEYYLRASAVYRMARFPIIRSREQNYAWHMNKELCLKGLSMREHPVREMMVPHTHAKFGEASVIPAYYLVPDSATRDAPVPLVIIFCGLDGYRTELAVWMDGFRQIDVATLVLEIPGTGDCPADPSDVTSPDRLYTSLLDWVALQEPIDQKRIAVWGFSTGGYYAIRVAHTHHDRIAGAISLGGGCHHMFDKEWLDEVNHLEYPFDLANALAKKWGYDDVEKFKVEGAKKFSLLNDGTLDKKECARLLLVNGVGDEIFPIDDYYLALHHGASKEARFVLDTKHMGEPESFDVCLRWLYKLFDIEGDMKVQFAALNTRPKFLEE